MDEQKEEKKFLIAVGSSVNHIGKWCLSFQGGWEGKLAENEQLRNDLIALTDALANKAIDLLDTDKCEIGFSAIDFLTNWVQFFTKRQDLNENEINQMNLITDIIFKRLSIPEWIEVEIEADDDQTEYEMYRKLMKMMFLNLVMIPSYRNKLLEKLYQFIQANQAGNTTSARVAEVSIILVYELYVVIPQQKRESLEQDHPIYKIVELLLTQNFLQYDFHLTTNQLFETVVRYCDFFRNNEAFFTTFIEQFFSDKAILHPTARGIASNTAYQFLRFLEKLKNYSCFANMAEKIAQNTLQTIEACESGQIKSDVLNEDDIGKLYSVLGQISCNDKIEESIRVTILTWSMNRLVGQLGSCP